MLLDVDVNGALKFQQFFGTDIFSVFLKTTDPVLAQRLRLRGESEDSISGRLKAAYKERRLVETGEFKPNLVLPYDYMDASEGVSLILTEVYQYMLQFA